MVYNNICRGCISCNPPFCLFQNTFFIFTHTGGYTLTKILVDADACPVKGIIEKTAKQYAISVTMLIDTSHELASVYSTIITIGRGKDAVDMALINMTDKGDIVVTQDYGVAAMALSKQAYAINQDGRVYSNANIDQLLFERHLSAKVRRAGGRTGKFKKRTEQDNDDFEQAFIKLCETVGAGS